MMRALLSATLALVAVGCQNLDFKYIQEPSSFKWDLPPGFPRPREFANNPMTNEKVELGRHLFYDKRLSGNQTQACAGCHHQDKAFSDGLTVGIGSTGQAHPRNSMSLINLAYQPVLTWANPLQTRLNVQANVPLFGTTPVELGLAGMEDTVVARLAADDKYVGLFNAAFAKDAPTISVAHIRDALEAFQRTLISGKSPYDKYITGTDKTAMNAAAKRGMNLFFGETADCFHCHAGITFSSAEDYYSKVAADIQFLNNGIYNVGNANVFPSGNSGLNLVTGNVADNGSFKAPTLRNIELTAPYMHDGSIATLDEVIEHYKRGGRNVTGRGTGFDGDGALNTRKNPLVKNFSGSFSAGDKSDLIEFLRSLTDTEFVNNPKFSNPWPKGSSNNP